MHDLAADCVGCHVLWGQILGIGGVEVSLLLFGSDGISAFLHFFGDGVGDLALHHISLASNAGDSGGRVLGRPILRVVGGHDLGPALTIDPVGSVVKHLVRVDWVVKVVVLLRDVLLGDSSTHTKQEG